MEKTLKTIQESFTREGHLLTDEVAKRNLELKECLHLLGEVSKEITNISAQHKRDIEDVIHEKDSHEKKVSQLKEEHRNTSASLDKTLSEKSTLLESLKRDIVVSEKRLSSVDNRIKTLGEEQKILEARVLEFRGVVSTIERSVSSLRSEESNLKKSIEEKKEEEAKLSDLVDKKKKDAARVSNDAEVIKKRTKK